MDLLPTRPLAHCSFLCPFCILVYSAYLIISTSSFSYRSISKRKYQVPKLAIKSTKAFAQKLAMI